MPAHCPSVIECARAHASDYNRAALLALGCTPALNLAGSLGPRENHELHSNCPVSSSPLASPFLSSSLSISSSAASTGVVGRWCGGGASTARYCISSSRAPHARAFRKFLRWRRRALMPTMWSLATESWRRSLDLEILRLSRQRRHGVLLLKP